MGQFFQKRAIKIALFVFFQLAAILEASLFEKQTFRKQKNSEYFCIL